MSKKEAQICHIYFKKSDREAKVNSANPDWTSLEQSDNGLLFGPQYENLSSVCANNTSIDQPVQSDQRLCSLIGKYHI